MSADAELGINVQTIAIAMLSAVAVPPIPHAASSNRDPPEVGVYSAMGQPNGAFLCSVLSRARVSVPHPEHVGEHRAGGGASARGGGVIDDQKARQSGPGQRRSFLPRDHQPPAAARRTTARAALHLVRPRCRLPARPARAVGRHAWRRRESSSVRPVSAGLRRRG